MAAARSIEPEHRVLWSGIAQQWDSLARQVGELDAWDRRPPEPRSWTSKRPFASRSRASPKH
jgi:uncharacterized protein YqcC (DUF446 family)